jgi:hypothetical protein
MFKKLLYIFIVLVLLPLLIACNGDEVDDTFDPTPYLTQAYQSLANYESKPITPFASKWIYTYTEDESLSVFHLFVEFNIPNDERIKYAVITIYIDRDTESLVNSFIDRMFSDELESTVSSLQSYNTFYTTVLGDMQSVETHIVTVGNIETSDIQKAMQGVTVPTS